MEIKLSGIFFLWSLFHFRRMYIALERRIRCKYKEYGIKAELPFNRAKVLILGDEGAGKTSTRKRLCGDGFHENMPRTEGIEITNVSYNWKKVTSSDEDFEKLASHVTVKEHFSTINEEFDESILMSTIGLYIGSIMVFTVLLHLYKPSIQIPYITLIRINAALPIASMYYKHCIVSGGFPVCRAFTHLAVAICATLIESTEYGPFLGQVIYNVVILLLYDGIFVAIGSEKFIFYRSILLGVFLMVHQVQHQLPNHEVGQMQVTWYYFTNFVYFLIFFVIENNFRYFLRQYFANMAHTIYLIVFMVLMIVIKSNIHALSLEQTIWLLNILYVYTWMFTHSIQLNSLGRSLIDYSQMPILFMKQGTGIIVGVFVVFICTYFTNHKNNITLEVISGIMVFMVVEVYLWIESETDIPMSHLNSAAAAYEFGGCPPDKRWIICDFAGQQIYYDTHHIFIPRQGVFLIVFDASEFIANDTEDSCCLVDPVKYTTKVERIKFWVQSVAIHADIDNSIVFVIGTHKNCLKDVELNLLSEILEDKLYSQYSSLLMFNRITNRMVFFIENENDVDEERAYLQMVIGREASKLPFVRKEWPIRYHLFQRIISSKRQQNEYVIKKSSLKVDIVEQCKISSQQKAAQESVKVQSKDQTHIISEEMEEGELKEQYVDWKGKVEAKNEEIKGEVNSVGELKLKFEFDKGKETKWADERIQEKRGGDIEEEIKIEEEVNNILKFFNCSGDIFYDPIGADDEDEEYVIIGLKILVDVVKALVNVPPRAIRERHIAEKWHILEKEGIVDKQFLTHIFRQHNIEEKHFGHMTDVLVKKEIMFAYNEQKFHLLCKLPKCELSEVEPTGRMVILYATFRVFRAEYIFLHLLPRLDNIQHDKTYRNAAEFKESSKCRYVIRVRETHEEGGPNSKIFESNVLKILIKCEDSFCALDVAFKIKAEIEQIFFSTRDAKANENLLNFGHLCMDCGALLAISLDQGTDVVTVPDIFHTIKVTKEEVIITCSAIVTEN